MTEVSMRLNLPYGLHMRPASVFVREAARFKSKITVFNGDQMADAKSIMGLLTLALGNGSNMRIVAEGEDERQAVEYLQKVVRERLEEPIK